MEDFCLLRRLLRILKKQFLFRSPFFWYVPCENIKFTPPRWPRNISQCVFCALLIVDDPFIF